jgi:hypothetical protein
LFSERGKVLALGWKGKKVGALLYMVHGAGIGYTYNLTGRRRKRRSHQAAIESNDTMGGVNLVSSERYLHKLLCEAATFTLR